MSDDSVTKVYVLYHANCPDGFGAALAAWLALRDLPSVDATYLPVSYGQPLPDLPGADSVYILDFSYPRDVLDGLMDRLSYLCVLDHHKTAQEALADLQPDPHQRADLTVVFDMQKSGARLAWEHFHPGIPLPMLLAYVEDRDLWRHQLPDSRELNAGLLLQRRELSVWATMADRTQWPKYRARLISQGEAVLRHQARNLETLIGHTRRLTVRGPDGWHHDIPVVNSPLYQSELGEALLDAYPDAPFAASYYMNAHDQAVWSLRSRPDFDVSAVARANGGGGHPQAAGFVVPALFAEMEEETA